MNELIKNIPKYHFPSSYCNSQNVFGQSKAVTQQDPPLFSAQSLALLDIMFFKGVTVNFKIETIIYDNQVTVFLNAISKAFNFYIAVYEKKAFLGQFLFCCSTSSGYWGKWCNASLVSSAKEPSIGFNQPVVGRRHQQALFLHEKPK